MSTMNISLTPQLEKLVQDRVRSGRYTSASEVIREALRLMDERDRLLEAKLEHLRQDVIASHSVVYESWILARLTRAQLTTADNRAV